MERAQHREWIGGRIFTLLSHYFRPNDPIVLTSAIGKDWADVLESLSAAAIQSACIKWQQTDTRRKTTPSDIYSLAFEIEGKQAIVAAAEVTSAGSLVEPNSVEQTAIGWIKSQSMPATSVTNAMIDKFLYLGWVTEADLRAAGRHA